MDCFGGAASVVTTQTLYLFQCKQVFIFIHLGGQLLQAFEFFLQ